MHEIAKTSGVFAQRIVTTSPDVTVSTNLGAWVNRRGLFAREELNLARDIASGGCWMRRPGPNTQVVVAYTGSVAPEAIEAVGLMAEDRRDAGLLAITLADRL